MVMATSNAIGKQYRSRSPRLVLVTVLSRPTFGIDQGSFMKNISVFSVKSRAIASHFLKLYIRIH